MINVMFGIVAVIVGAPILACTVYVAYEFISDVIEEINVR